MYNLVTMYNFYFFLALIFMKTTLITIFVCLIVIQIGIVTHVYYRNMYVAKQIFSIT